MIPHSRKVSASRRELDHLEEAIRLLKIEFDKFFNGALQIPPEELRTKVKKRVQQLRNRRLRTSADRFRLNSLETRLNVFGELWDRRLREIERAASRPATVAAPKNKTIDPMVGVNLGGTDRRDEVEALYNTLYSSAGRTRKTDFDSFRRYLDNQISTLKKKTGCDQVQFRVAGVGRKLTLKAKPIKQQKDSGGA